MITTNNNTIITKNKTNQIIKDNTVLISPLELQQKTKRRSRQQSYWSEMEGKAWKLLFEVWSHWILSIVQFALIIGINSCKPCCSFIVQWHWHLFFPMYNLYRFKLVLPVHCWTDAQQNQEYPLEVQQHDDFVLNNRYITLWSSASPSFWYCQDKLKHEDWKWTPSFSSGFWQLKVQNPKTSLVDTSHACDELISIQTYAWNSFAYHFLCEVRFFLRSHEHSEHADTLAQNTEKKSTSTNRHKLHENSGWQEELELKLPCFAWNENSKVCKIFK